MPSQVKQGPARSSRTKMLHFQTTSAWLKHTSLRFEPVPRAQLIMYHRFHCLTHFVLSPQLQAVYDFCCPLEQVSPLVSDRMALPNQFMPCAPLAVSSPPWGGDTSSKKKMSGGMFVHQDLFGLPLWDAPRRVSRRVLAPFFHCPILASFLFVAPKKKRERGTTHENCKCYAASSSAMVEPDTTFSRCSTCSS